MVVIVNPTSLALLKPPSEFGADIVVGDGQPLGIHYRMVARTLAYLRRVKT